MKAKGDAHVSKYVRGAIIASRARKRERREREMEARWGIKRRGTRDRGTEVKEANRTLPSVYTLFFSFSHMRQLHNALFRRATKLCFYVYSCVCLVRVKTFLSNAFSSASFACIVVLIRECIAELNEKIDAGPRSVLPHSIE